MASNIILGNALSEKDLGFVIQTIAPHAKNNPQLERSIREDPSFRKVLLSDRRIFQRVISAPPSIIRISPLLFFEVLLRQAIEEMRTATHTVERTASQKIPVFDINEALRLLNKDNIPCYLVDLLISFVRYEKQNAKDIDLDRLIKLGKEAEGEKRFFIHKRIADTCLFVLGIFPECVTYDYIYLFFGKKMPISGEPRKSMGDYETLGQEFYALASEHEIARAQGLQETFQLLAENFYSAKKPLNIISNYLASAKEP